MIFQLKVKGTFWSFNSQIYLLRVVSSLLFSCLKDDLWPPYLSLNGFAVSPIYVSVLIGLMVSTDARYIIEGVWHFPRDPGYYQL